MNKRESSAAASRITLKSLSMSIVDADYEIANESYVRASKAIESHGITS